MAQIIVVDTGGQYCHLIARRVRELGVQAEIGTPELGSKINDLKGIIISGGPRSVNDSDAIECSPELFKIGVPVLGICYGHQLMAKTLGGIVQSSGRREFSEANLEIIGGDTILNGLKENELVWMSHGDEVVSVPSGFEILARTKNCSVATMIDRKRKLFGLQFHPEVAHTPCGNKVFSNFLFRVCKCNRDWNVRSQISELLKKIRQQVGNRNVLFFVSGGVDSSVAFALCTQALGPDRVLGIFVNTGFMRKYDEQQLREITESNKWKNIHFIDASEIFIFFFKEYIGPRKEKAYNRRLFLGGSAASFCGFRIT